MNELLFLGRGSGYHIEEDNTSCFYLKDKTMLLIDCGETVFKSLLKLNILNQVENLYILITHMHSDHIGSLAGLVGYCQWKYQLISTILYPKAELMTQYLDLLGMNEKEKFTIKSEPINKIADLGLTITAIPTVHAENAFSYLLTFEEGNDIFYSGDSRITISQPLEFIDMGNIIYQDLTLSTDSPHMSLAEMSELIPKSKRKSIYCMHIDGANYNKIIMAEGYRKVKCIEKDCKE